MRLWGSSSRKEESDQIYAILVEASARNQPKSYLFKNASILSMVDQDVVIADVLVEDGIIQQIGQNLETTDTIKIDAKGEIPDTGTF